MKTHHLYAALVTARSKLKDAHEYLSRTQKDYFELSKELESTKKELRTMTVAYDAAIEMLSEKSEEIKLLKKELLIARSFDPFNPTGKTYTIQKELPLC